MVNPTEFSANDSSIRDSYRHKESPALWIGLTVGSVLIHLLLFFTLRQYLTRTAKVEIRAAPISVEFIEPPKMAEAKSKVSKPKTPVQRVQPTAAKPVVVEKEPAIAPPTSQPISQPRPSSPQPSRTTKPLEKPTPTPTPVTSPAPTSEPQKGDEPSNSTLSDQASTDAPVSSGTPLPSVQGESALVEIIGTPRQIQDIKRQPARPNRKTQEIQLYLSAKPDQPLELEVHLEISATGDLSPTPGAKPLSPPTAALDQQTLDGLARQIFKDWRFEPAQDAPDGEPLKPVYSDLYVEIRITF